MARLYKTLVLWQIVQDLSAFVLDAVPFAAAFEPHVAVSAVDEGVVAVVDATEQFHTVHGDAVVIALADGAVGEREARVVVDANATAVEVGVILAAVQDLAVVHHRGFLGAVVFDTLPIAGFVLHATENDGLVGSAVGDEGHDIFHVDVLIALEVHLRARLDGELEAASNPKAPFHIIRYGHGLQRGVLFHVDVAAVGVDEVVAVALEGVIGSQVEETNPIFTHDGVLGAVLDGVSLKGGEAGLILHIDAIAERAVDGAVLHGNLGALQVNDGVPNVVVRAAIDELDVFPNVVGTLRVESDLLPRAFVGVVGRADKLDGLVGSTHHTEAGVFAHFDGSIGASEHDGDTGFDGEEGVAVDVHFAVDDVVHGQAEVGPSGVGIDVTGNLGRVGGLAATSATSVAEGHGHGVSGLRAVFSRHGVDDGGGEVHRDARRGIDGGIVRNGDDGNHGSDFRPFRHDGHDGLGVFRNRCRHLGRYERERKDLLFAAFFRAARHYGNDCQ